MPDNTIPWVWRLCCSCYQHTQLKLSVTRIVSELKFFHRTFIQSDCGYRHYSIFQSMWCGQFQCTVICLYMSSQFRSSRSVIFGTESCSQCLFWADISRRIFSNAQNTVTSHGSLCSSSSITTVFSFFLIAFVVKFCINHFQCLHLKKFIFVYYILWRICTWIVCIFHTALMVNCLCVG